MLSVRKGLLSDFDFYYNLKKESSSIRWGGFKCAPDYDNLHTHYNNLVEGKVEGVEIYFVMDDDCLVGYFQLTDNKEKEVEIGYGISEKYTGKGYGTFAINSALNICYEKNEKLSVVAYVREDNVASKKCFEKNGFVQLNDYHDRYMAYENKTVRMYKFVDSKTALEM